MAVTHSIDEIKQLLAAKDGKITVTIATDGERDDEAANQSAAHEILSAHPNAKIHFILNEGNPDYQVSTKDRLKNLTKLAEFYPDNITVINGAPRTKANLSQDAAPYQPSEEVKTALQAADIIIAIAAPIELYTLLTEPAEKSPLPNLKAYIAYAAANTSWLVSYIMHHEGLDQEDAYKKAESTLTEGLNNPFILQNAMLEQYFRDSTAFATRADKAVKSITPNGWGLLYQLVLDLQEHGNEETKSMLTLHTKAALNIARKQTRKVAAYLKGAKLTESLLTKLGMAPVKGESIEDFLIKNMQHNNAFASTVNTFLEQNNAHKIEMEGKTIPIARAASILYSTGVYPLQSLIADQHASTLALSLLGLTPAQSTRLLSKQAFVKMNGRFPVFDTAPHNPAQAYHFDPMKELHQDKQAMAELMIIEMTILHARAINAFHFTLNLASHSPAYRQLSELAVFTKSPAELFADPDFIANFKAINEAYSQSLSGTASSKASTPRHGAMWRKPKEEEAETGQPDERATAGPTSTR